MNKANRVLLILTTVGIAILLGVIIEQGVQLKGLKQAAQVKIEGTYTSSNSPGVVAEYIVLKQDNICDSYVQMGAVESGTYTVDGRTVTMEFPDLTLCGVHADGQLYVFSQEDTMVAPYLKLSDTPVYVNVKREATP